MTVALRRRWRAAPVACGAARRAIRRRLDFRASDLFSFEGIRVKRDGRTALELHHVSVPNVGSTAIIGPSGSGKSSLLRLCNRLEAPSSGTIRYLGEDVAALDPIALRRRVSMVFQQPVSLGGTVADNLRQADPNLSQAAIAMTLERVGLSAELSRPDGDLSGGERQRLGLARSLINHPDVLLLDEVTSALDPSSAVRVEQLVNGLVAQGIAAVWVTHDLDQLARVAQHVLVVIGGRVVQHGPVDQVLAAPVPEVRGFLTGDSP